MIVIRTPGKKQTEKYKYIQLYHIVMKHIHISLDNEDFEVLDEIKGKTPWNDFIMLLSFENIVNKVVEKLKQMKEEKKVARARARAGFKRKAGRKEDGK